MQVQQPVLSLFGGNAVLTCGSDGRLVADEQHGLFVLDTRLLSTYRMTVSSSSWVELGRAVADHASARWSFENPAMRDATGDVPRGTLLLTIDRQVNSGMVDRLSVTNFGPRTVRL